MKLIEFKPPPELLTAVGEAVKPGQTMELMATFRVKPNGNWCVIEIEGVRMPGYKEGEDNEAPPERSEYVKSAMENMPRYGAA